MANRFQHLIPGDAQKAKPSNRFAHLIPEKTDLPEDTVIPKDRPSLAQRNEAVFYGIADTMGMGLADEGAGLIDVVVQKLKGDKRPVSQIYSDFVNKARGDMAAASEAAPTDYTVGQVFGVLPTLGAGAARTAAAKAPGMIRRAWEGAKAGAAYGGAYGFGSGEGLEGSAKGALAGAATGAGVGAALPIAGAAVTAPFKVVKTVAQRKGSYAAEQIAKAAKREGKTVPQVQQELQQLQQTNPDALVIDALGESGGRLGRAAANRGGEGAQELSKAVYSRQAGQNDRITGRVAKDLGDPNAYQKTLDDSIDALRTNAKPLYDAAFNVKINYLRHGPAITRAWSRIPERLKGQVVSAANDILIAEGKKPKAIGQVIGRDAQGRITPLPTVEQWDYIKRGIDAVIGAENTKGAAGGMSAIGRALTGAKNALMKEIDNAVPVYKKARGVYSDDLSVKNALELGRQSLNTDAPMLEKTIAGLDNASKDTFRVGYARAMADIIDRMGPGHDAIARLWAAPGRQKRLKAVFGDIKRFEQFADFARGEEKMRKSYTALNGNSTTVRQLTDLQDAGLSGAEPMIQAGAQVIRGDFGGAALTAIRKVLHTMSGLTEARADEIARILASPSIPQGTVSKAGQYQMSAQQRAVLGALLRNSASHGSAVAASGQR